MLINTLSIWFITILIQINNIRSLAITSTENDHQLSKTKDETGTKNDNNVKEQIKFGDRSSKGSYRFMKNSKICETTPGVETYSGYLELGNNQSMFFWFFEARNNPVNASFALWLNGGPGCSSMIGLFQENGPCKISEDGTKVIHNPYSWNEHTHMLYLDQPIQTGFSYGTNDVTTTLGAATHVWDFFQIFLGTKTFEKYASREFGLWTESYGGHYGPKFAEYFQAQNALIKSGKVSGHPIKLIAVGIYESYYDFAQAKFNKKFDLVDQETLKNVKKDLYKEGGCLSQLKECDRTGNNQICRDADKFCEKKVSDRALGKKNPYDILYDATVEIPSESYTKFLQIPWVLQAIGAESKYDECSDKVYDQFMKTGDDARSAIPALAKSLNAGLRHVLWAGSDDYVCNTLGGIRAINNMDWKYKNEFNNAVWKELIIKGESAGIYKTAGPLTYIEMFNAGHEVSAFVPIPALEIFRQTMFHEPIHST